MFHSFIRYFSFLSFFLLLFVSSMVNATQTFDGSGTVNKVIPDEGIIIVNESKFFLSNNVYNSGSSSNQPVIYSLKKGTEIGFSGVESNPFDRITSINIHRQPD